MTLGEIIKQYRESHGGMSLRRFADLCGNGITHGYISMLEKNRNPKTGKGITPSFEVYKIVSKAMGMPLDTLLEMVDQRSLISLAPYDETRDPKAEKIQEIIDIASALPPEKLALAQAMLKAIAENA